MTQQEESAAKDYPRGRGYGDDYMRGGEVLGGYGYSQREEYERPRGELNSAQEGGSVENAGPDEDTEASSSPGA